MRKKTCSVLSLIIGTLLPVCTYAHLNNSHYSGSNNALLQNPVTAKIIANYNHELNTTWKYSPAIQAKLKAVNQQQIHSLIDLKEKISKLNFSEKQKALTRLDNLIEKYKKSDPIIANEITLNFLDLQLQDAFSLLNAVNLAATNTQAIFQDMLTLAVAAANGVYTPSQLSNMNTQYQAYKSTINYIQTIDLNNGEKKVSGGDINIQFGNSTDPQSRLTINMPAFDLAGLGLADSRIETIQDANDAIQAIYNANKIMMTVLTKISLNINDAYMMILTAGSSLNKQLELLSQAQVYSLSAVNGITSDDDRVNLDMAFSYVKSAMNQAQTYVSLDGPKKFGGGDVHIQIGPYASPETVLTIHLPVTDVAKLGLDKLDLKSQETADATLTSILDDIRIFIYGDKNQTA